MRGCDSSNIERMSPWVERKSRGPSGTAITPSEVGSALPNQRLHLDRVGSRDPPQITHLCDLTDMQRESSTLKETSGLSLEHPHCRSRNPAMSTSHMDLSPVVRYPGEYDDREHLLAARARGNRPTAICSDDSMLSMTSRDDDSIQRSFVNDISIRPEVVRWLERMGPDVECPTISELAGSSTRCNTVRSSSISPMHMISDTSFSAPRQLPHHFEHPSSDDDEVTPLASRTDSSSCQITTRTHDDSFAKESAMPFDEDGNIDALLSGALIEITELTDTLMDITNGDIHSNAEPITAAYVSQPYSGDTSNVGELQPSEPMRHLSTSPRSAGHKSAIPRLTSLNSVQNSRDVFKQDAPETKPLSPRFDGMVSSKERTIRKPQFRQQISEETIGRRHCRKQNVSTEGLQQGGDEIDSRYSVLEDTLLAYQAWLRTGGNSSAGMMSPNSDRDGRSTSPELDHVGRLAPRSGSGIKYNPRYHSKQETIRHSPNTESQQHESKIPICMSRRISPVIVRQLVETPTAIAVDKQELGRQSDTHHANKRKHCDIVVKRKDADIVARKTRSPTAHSERHDITAVAHQADTVTVKHRLSRSVGNCVKDAAVIGQSRRPICSRNVPKAGFVNIKHDQVHAVDGHQPLKNTGKSHRQISKASDDVLRVSTADKQGPESAKNAPSRGADERSFLSIPGNERHIPCTKRIHFSGDTKQGSSACVSQPGLAALLPSSSLKTPDVNGRKRRPSKTHVKQTPISQRQKAEKCNSQPLVCTKYARPPAPSRHQRQKRSGHNTRNSADNEINNGPMFAPTLTQRCKKPSITTNKSGSNTYRKSTGATTNATKSSEGGAKMSINMFAPTLTTPCKKPSITSNKSGSSTYGKRTGDTTNVAKSSERKKDPMLAPPPCTKPSISSNKSGSSTYGKRTGDTTNVAKSSERKKDPMLASPRCRPKKPSITTNNSGSSTYRKSAGETTNVTKSSERQNGPRLSPTLKSPCKTFSITSNKSGSSTYRKSVGDTTNVSKSNAAGENNNNSLFSSSCNNNGETKPLTGRQQPSVPVGRGLAAFRGKQRSAVSGSDAHYATPEIRLHPNVGTFDTRDRRTSRRVRTGRSNSNVDRLHEFQQVTIDGTTVVDGNRLGDGATIPRPQRQLLRVTSRDRLLPKRLQCT